MPLTVTPTPYRIIAPLEALFIIGWWAYDLIDGEAGDGEKWYEFGRETLVITVVQVTMATSTSNSYRRDLILQIFLFFLFFALYFIEGRGSNRFLMLYYIGPRTIFCDKYILTHTLHVQFVVIVHRRKRFFVIDESSMSSKDWKLTHHDQRLLVWYVGLEVRLSYKTTKNSYCSNSKIILLLFQWGGLMVLLFSINMIYLCCQRTEGEETVRLLGRKDLETSDKEKVISYKDVQLWWMERALFKHIFFVCVKYICGHFIKSKRNNSPPIVQECSNVSLQMPGFLLNSTNYLHT